MGHYIGERSLKIPFSNECDGIYVGPISPISICRPRGEIAVGISECADIA